MGVVSAPRCGMVARLRFIGRAAAVSEVSALGSGAFVAGPAVAVNVIALAGEERQGFPGQPWQCGLFGFPVTRCGMSGLMKEASRHKNSTSVYSISSGSERAY